MKVYSSNFLEVDYHADHGWLCLRCFGKLESKEFRESLEKALEFAEENQVKQWLLDFREIGSLDENEDAWLQSYLFPKIMMRLGTSNYIAIVLSEKCYEVLLKEAGKFGLKSYNSFIIINTFYNLDEASRWLKKHRINKAS
ncbi:hypothetical protein ACFSRY_16610 [Pontibacter locisalis]|uniref:SpoIIAA-like n=1 Tax=Pontibacter locisalis TaxID=1719035 RepID=A0ABW5IPA8_9BACT